VSSGSSACFTKLCSCRPSTHHPPHSTQPTATPIRTPTSSSIPPSHGPHRHLHRPHPLRAPHGCRAAATPPVSSCLPFSSLPDRLLSSAPAAVNLAARVVPTQGEEMNRSPHFPPFSPSPRATVVGVAGRSSAAVQVAPETRQRESSRSVSTLSIEMTCEEVGQALMTT
jgi:hypothetical protein